MALVFVATFEVNVDWYLVEVRHLFERDSPKLALLYAGFVEEWCRERSTLSVRGGDLSVESRVVGVVEIDVGKKLPYDVTPSSVNFDDVIVLAGCVLPEAMPAQVLPVTLCFRARNHGRTDLTAFVHLIGPDGKFISGFDQPLAEGRFPASRWQPGDMSVGDWSVTLPSQLASGIHEVWVGMYGSDGVRSEVFDTDQEVFPNRVLLGMVKTKLGHQRDVRKD